ncbi:MAG: hypothetical protein OXF74_08645 [Rhodobacteraceae bacterium]|nr:hypothetical protein [Paracoccaceae bacterium]
MVRNRISLRFRHALEAERMDLKKIRAAQALLLRRPGASGG